MSATKSHIINKLINKLLSLFSLNNVSDFILGANGYRFLSRLKEEESDVVIALTTLIGDSVYGLSCIEDFHQHNLTRNVIVVGNEKYRALLSSYPYIDKLILLSAKSTTYRHINGFLRTTSLSRFGLAHGVINANPWLYKNLRKGKNIEVFHLLRNSIFRLPEEGKITYHNTSFDMKYLRLTDISPNERIAIINPYSVSLNTSSENIFVDICKTLVENRYTVYTNTVNEQRALPGTKPIKCSIYELYSLACISDLIVSIRSGILDFLVSSNINMFIIYENTNNAFFNMYQLKAWQCSGKIEEILIDSEYDYKAIQNRFKQYLCHINTYTKGKK